MFFAQLDHVKKESFAVFSFNSLLAKKTILRKILYRSRQASVDNSVLQGLDQNVPSVAPVVIEDEYLPPSTTSSTTSGWQSSTSSSGDNGQWQDDGQWGGQGGGGEGQDQWKPPVTTTTETSFVETSVVKEPLSGDYKVVCCEFFF